PPVLTTRRGTERTPFAAPALPAAARQPGGHEALTACAPTRDEVLGRFRPRFRVAVVGTGFGARIHVPGFRLSGRFDVVALIGRSPDRLAQVAARCEVARTCGSLEEALAIPGLDAVSIVTPPFLHAEQAIAAARAGKHV